MALALEAFTSLVASPTHAGTLTTTYLRLNRMKSGTATTVRLVFKTAGAGATTVAIDMNGTDSGTAQWTNATPGGLVNTTQATSVATCPTESGAAALPGTLSASGSGSVITITGVTALSATTAYCVDLTTSSSITTPTVTGEYHPTITVGSDSTNVAVRVISNDQITTTATVPPTFNFVLSGNTDNFTGNLSTSSIVSTTGINATVTTNASSGWITWAKGTNVDSSDSPKGALKSAAAGNRTIPQTEATALGAASFTPATGAEHYGLGATINTDASGGGTVSLDSAYDGTSNKIGVLDTSIFRPIASANGPANGDIITVTERATISGLTPAANDYTDTITLIGAGNF